MTFYISSSCSSQKRLPDVLNELIDVGFRRIALTGDVEYSENIKESVLRFKEAYHLDIILHNYFAFQPEEFVLNLASGDPEIQDKTLKHIRDCVDLLTKLGKNLYSLHPGLMNDLQPILREGYFIKSNDRVNSREDFYHMVDRVMDEIVTDDFRIAVENLHPKSDTELYSFLCTPDDIIEFLKRFNNRDNVGIVLDLGHLNVSARRLNFDKYQVLDEIFSNHMDRIFEIHVSENDGLSDAHGISEIESWQIKYLEKYRQELKMVPVVLEWHHSAHRQAFGRYLSIREKLEDR